MSELKETTAARQVRRSPRGVTPLPSTPFSTPPHPYSSQAGLVVGALVSHPRHGVGEVKDVLGDGVRVVTFNDIGGDGQTHRYKPSSLHKVRKIDRATFDAAVSRGGHVAIDRATFDESGLEGTMSRRTGGARPDTALTLAPSAHCSTSACPSAHRPARPCIARRPQEAAEVGTQSSRAVAGAASHARQAAAHAHAAERARRRLPRGRLVPRARQA